MSTELSVTTAHWRKSSYSGSEGGECVEVADLGARVAVRDSKAPHGPVLAFPPSSFAALIHSVGLSKG